MGREPGASRAFWTGLPGVLTGLAALLTAVVGAVALLGGQGDDGGDAPTPGPAAAVRDLRPEPAPAAAAPAATGTGAPAAAAARHLLLEDDYLDLETGLVGSGVAGDLQWQSSYLWVTAPARALVPAASDVAGCPAVLAGRLDAGAVDPERVRRGVLVCLRTDEGTVALVRAGPPDGLGQLPVEVTPLG